jgi:hypothetical protein
LSSRRALTPRSPRLYKQTILFIVTAINRSTKELPLSADGRFHV